MSGIDLAFACEKCGQFTSLSDGSLACINYGKATRESNDWKLVCCECSTEWVYWIDFGRLIDAPCRHPGDDTIEGWDQHLSEKAWFNPRQFFSAVERLRQLRRMAQTRSISSEVVASPPEPPRVREHFEERAIETEVPLPGAIRLEIRAFRDGVWGPPARNWDAPIRDVSFAVYALQQGGITLYVGQSISVRSRLKTHVAHRPFCTAFVLPCERSALDRIEQEAIRRLNPPWNKVHRTRGSTFPIFLVPPEAMK